MSIFTQPAGRLCTGYGFSNSYYDDLHNSRRFLMYDAVAISKLLIDKYVLTGVARIRRVRICSQYANEKVHSKAVCST